MANDEWRDTITIAKNQSATVVCGTTKNAAGETSPSGVASIAVKPSGTPPDYLSCISTVFSPGWTGHQIIAGNEDVVSDPQPATVQMPSITMDAFGGDISAEVVVLKGT